MAEDPLPEPQSFGAGTHLYVVVGGFTALLDVLGIFVGLKQGDWTVLLVGAGGAAVLFALLQILRLEVRPDGIQVPQPQRFARSRVCPCHPRLLRGYRR